MKYSVNGGGGGGARIDGHQARGQAPAVIMPYCVPPASAVHPQRSGPSAKVEIPAAIGGQKNVVVSFRVCVKSRRSC